MSIVEEFTHKILTAFQQIRFATCLIELNNNNIEEYSNILEQKVCVLEEIEGEIIERFKLNEFDKFRDIIFQQLTILRQIPIAISIFTSRELNNKFSELSKEIKQSIERIKQIGNGKRV